jgi:hypothetical protein
MFASFNHNFSFFIDQTLTAGNGRPSDSTLLSIVFQDGRGKGKWVRKKLPRATTPGVLVLKTVSQPTYTVVIMGIIIRLPVKVEGHPPDSTLHHSPRRQSKGYRHFPAPAATGLFSTSCVLFP